MNTKKISIIGDGAWGTALAILLDNQGNDVCLWGAFSDYVAELKRTRKNAKYLPGPSIPDSIGITANIEECLLGTELIVNAIPAQYTRAVAQRIRPVIDTHNSCPPVVNVAKGVEVDSLKRMDEVLAEELNTDEIAVLSGPTHAEEVAIGVPSAAVVASKNNILAQQIQSIFSTDTFRVYTSTDLIGVELGGALKNVIAVASGICDGLQFGDNTKAALITRGLSEITRLGVAMGADPLTFSGLSGMGDLIVTCMSRHSRNRAFGEKIGQGMSFEQIRNSTEKIAEGVFTVKAVTGLAKRYNVDTPISEKVYEVLYENRSCMDAFRELMERDLKPEIRWQ